MLLKFYDKYRLSFLFLIIFVMVFCFSCSPKIDVTNPIENKSKNLSFYETDIDAITTELMRIILNKFYNFEFRRVVSIHISDIEGTYKQEAKSPSYLKFKLEKIIKQKFSAIKVVDKKYDCDVKFRFFEKEGKPHLSVSLCNKQHQFFYSENFKLSEKDFTSPEYISFEIVPPSQRKTAFLKITYENSGDKTILHDGYYKRTKLVKACYPAEHQCVINGAKYNPSENHVFFNGKVSPGKYVIAFAFKGAKWDQRDRSQTIVTTKMTKTIELFLKENEVQNIKVTFVYSSDEAGIVIEPFGYVTTYDQKGKMLESFVKLDPAESKAIENDLRKISDLIDKYSLHKIIEMIFAIKGSITIEINNDYKKFDEFPNLKYVNNRTIYLDLKKTDLSIEDAEKKLILERELRMQH